MAIRTVPAQHATIGAAVTASTTGDIINVSAGTYREHVIIPLAKTLELNFAIGAVIDGRDVGGTMVRSRWIEIFSPNTIVRNATCIYANNNVGGDDRGALYIDPSAAGTQILGGEYAYALGRNMMTGRASNTLVDGVNTHHGGSLNIHFGGIGTGCVVRNSLIHHANEPRPWQPFMGGTATSPAAPYVLYAGGPLVIVSTGWESGGTKGISHSGMIFENNEVYNNIGPGLWSDSVPPNPQTANWIVRRNDVHDNAGSGIFCEVTAGGQIYENYAHHNGGSASQAGSAYYGNGNITVSSSKDVSVHHNVVQGGLIGVNFFAQNRPDRPGISDGTAGQNLWAYENWFISDVNNWIALGWANESDPIFTTGGGWLNQFWWPTADGTSGSRFAFLGEKSTMAALNSTNGGNRNGAGASFYMTTAVKDGILAGTGPGGAVFAAAGPISGTTPRTLIPTGITSAQTFGTATIYISRQTVSPAGIAPPGGTTVTIIASDSYSR